MHNIFEKAKLSALSVMAAAAGLAGATVTASPVYADVLDTQGPVNPDNKAEYTVSGYDGYYYDYFDYMTINGEWVFCTEPAIWAGGNYTAPGDILKTNVVVRSGKNGELRTPTDWEKIQGIGMIWAMLKADPALVDEIASIEGYNPASEKPSVTIAKFRAQNRGEQYGILQYLFWQLFGHNKVQLNKANSGRNAISAWEKWYESPGSVEGTIAATDIHRVGNLIAHAWEHGHIEYGNDAYFLFSDTGGQRIVTTGGTFRLAKGSIELQKVSSNPTATNGNANYSVEGAVYELKSSKHTYTVTTGKDGKAKLDNIFAGTYTLKETKAPKGFELNPETYTVTVRAGRNTVIPTTSTTDAPQLGAFELQKRSNDPGMTEPNSNYQLKGAVFELVGTGDVEGKKFRLVTDDKGFARVENIPFGQYTLREVSAPKGFAVNAEPQGISIVSKEAQKKVVGEEPKDSDPYTIAVKQDAELNKFIHGDANVEGAEYEIRLYNETDLTAETVKNAKPYATIEAVVMNDGQFTFPKVPSQLKVDLQTRKVSMPIGSYAIVETKAPAGYLLNEEIIVRNVKDGGSVTTTNPQDVTGNFGTAQIKEQVIRGGVQVVKVDKELGKSEAIGGADHNAGSKDGADLNGITFEIKNASAASVMVGGKEYQPGDVVATIATSWNKEVGAYTAQTAADALPYGTYSIKEVETNGSYLLTDETERVFQIRENGVIVKATTAGTPLTFANQIIRGDFKFNKIVDGSADRLSTAFVVTNVTTGEKHIIVTDKNGEFSSTDYKHSASTNANDKFLAAAEAGDVVKMSEMDMKAGTWFGKAEDGSVAPVNDDLGALPYGKYTLSEMRTDTNEGLKLITFDFYIYKDSKEVDLGTITDDREEVEVGTTLVDSNTKDHIAPANGKVTLVDTVTYKNARPGKEYTVKGVLMDKSTGGKFISGGKEVTAITTFVAEAANGSVDVTFEFDASAIAGKSVVAFEDLYEGDIKVASHADINDEGQTVNFPEVGTTLTDTKTKSHVAKAEEKVTLVDVVAYKNLIPGKEYTVSGELYNKADGKSIGVKGSTKFVAKEPNGSVEIKFEFDASKLQGKSVVAFESVSYKGIEVAVHADINDESQTVNFPKIGTTLVDTDTRGHVAVADEKVTLIDTVAYENLVPGKEYTVSGELYNKADGKSIGVKGSTKFVASAKNGTVDVVFEFDASKLAGKSVVAFESVSHEGVEIAVHADINDEGQTVNFPKIGTTLVDTKSQSHQALAEEKTVLVDTVKYENLIPGKEYTVSGTLMDKATGKAIQNADGSEIVASTTFTAKEANGSVEVVFEFDARVLAGKTVVAFEDVSHEGVTVGVHADINDEAQTVNFPKVGTTLVDSKTKDHVALAEEKVKLIDTVKYENLIPGKEYTVNGELYDKETGKSIDVKASTTFTAKEPNGTVDVVFEFDASKLAGKSVVAFEDLYDGKILVATHSDINDKEQTVDFPSLGTTLVNKVDQAKTIDPSTKTVLVDTVRYTGLIVGKEYTVKGELYDKETGKSIGVKASTTFTPKEPNGSVEVVFEFDSSKLAGKSVVAFEELYSGDVLIGVHADINDEGQTVTFRKPETPKTETPETPRSSRTSNRPNTGVGGLSYGAIAVIVAAILGGAGFAGFAYKKKNKKA